MSIYELKPAFQNLLRPVCRQLARIGVTPNQVTVLGAVLSIATGVICAINIDQPAIFLLVPALLFLRMALNALDGMLAREHNMQSALGGFLNELGDVVSDVAIYLPFAFLPGVSTVAILSLAFLAVLSEMAGVIAVQIGGTRRYDGPMGKSDRAFFFGVLATAIGLGLPVGMWVQTLLVFVCLMTFATIVNRIRRSVREVEAVA